MQGSILYLVLVFLASLILSSGVATPDLPTLNRLLQARDTAGLSAFLDSGRAGPNPMSIVANGGAYGVGTKGWQALALADPVRGTDYVVFTTPLTGEDSGELLFERAGKQLHFIEEDHPFGIHIEKHRFDVRFNLPAKQAIIVDDLAVDRTGPDGPAFMRFSPCYQVDSISEGRNKITFRQAGGVVLFDIGSGHHDLKVSYRGTVNLPQYAASISESEATLTNDYWFPMIARQPAPYDITVHTPHGWTAVGQGELVSHTTGVDEDLWQYTMKLPVSYYSLSVAPYKHKTVAVNGLNYSVYSAAMSERQMEEQTEFYPPIIEFYSRNFAKFPFSGYAAVVSQSYGGGAMEAYSYATYGTGWLPAEDAHEPSHTWWGGIIPNTYLHSFWNESFADFSESVYHRNVPIGNIAEQRMAFISHADVGKDYWAAPLDHSGVAIGHPASTLGYGKGSFVLVALEDELGTATMLKCCQRWLSDQPKQTAGEWSGFEAAVRETAGKEMTWFFDEWVRRPGYIQLSVKNVKLSNRHLTGEVSQTGTPYRFQLEVLLRGQKMKDRLVKVEVPAQKKFNLDLPAPVGATIASFDPYRRLIRAFEPGEAPLSAKAAFESYKRYSSSEREGAILKIAGLPYSQLPANLDRVTIAGMPDDLPIIKSLGAKLGLSFEGNLVTYEGTTVDLTKGAVLALVPLGGGKTCLLALGKPDIAPNPGDAAVAVCDHLGRFLRGNTAPKLSGPLVFNLKR